MALPEAPGVELPAAIAGSKIELTGQFHRTLASRAGGVKVTGAVVLGVTPL
jgi:hypothetical protein